MTRDELLTNLAMELSEWPDFQNCEAPDPVCPGIWYTSAGEWVCYARGDDSDINKTQWLARRTDLINEPDDADAPKWARWKAQDSNGVWLWHECEPKASDIQWDSELHINWARPAGQCPAGHDWRKTLKEVSVKRELNPITSSMTNSQAEEAAREFYLCSDGDPCGMDTYCDECPNKQADIDASRLDAQLADAMQKRPGDISAQNILTAASQHMKERAATYDKPQGERSMLATVEAFAATTGILLTEEHGWHFMALLKLVRSQQGDYRADSYEDGAAYFALMAEAASKERT